MHAVGGLWCRYQKSRIGAGHCFFAIFAVSQYLICAKRVGATLEILGKMRRRGSGRAGWACRRRAREFFYLGKLDAEHGSRTLC